MKLETKLLHKILIDKETNSITYPIYQTSTFIQEKPNINKGYSYSRTNNPTRNVLEKLISKLEYGKYCYAFSSGMSAIDSILKLINYNNEIIASSNIYGGTYRILKTIYNKYNIKTSFIDTCNIYNIINSINSKTKLLWLESPTNPNLYISDIKNISNICKKNKILFVVDNTFSTPISQNPLKLGADIVIHSGTKYLSGHSNVLSGLVILNNNYIAKKIKHIQNTCGAILSSFDSWIMLQNIQTLYLRYKKQCKNAYLIANKIKKFNFIKKVYYPLFNNKKILNILKKQQKLYGAIISFELKNNLPFDVKKFVSCTKIFKLAESLGGIKSLICHPYSMTHKCLPDNMKLSNGINYNLIRISCGIENYKDLINDIKNTFNNIIK